MNITIDDDGLSALLSRAANVGKMTYSVRPLLEGMVLHALGPWGIEIDVESVSFGPYVYSYKFMLWNTPITINGNDTFKAAARVMRSTDEVDGYDERRMFKLGNLERDSFKQLLVGHHPDLNMFLPFGQANIMEVMDYAYGQGDAIKVAAIDADDQISVGLAARLSSMLAAKHMLVCAQRPAQKRPSIGIRKMSLKKPHERVRFQVPAAATGSGPRLQTRRQTPRNLSQEVEALEYMLQSAKI